MPEPGVDVGWTTYTAPDGTFSANFPGEPEARELPPVPERLVLGGIEAQATSGAASFVVMASNMMSAYAYNPGAELALAGWQDSGPYEVGPGVVGTGFVSSPESPEARGFILHTEGRLYVIVATGASNEQFHTFIHGFRWIADPS